MNIKIFFNFAIIYIILKKMLKFLPKLKRFVNILIKMGLIFSQSFILEINEVVDEILKCKKIYLFIYCHKYDLFYSSNLSMANLKFVSFN